MADDKPKKKTTSVSISKEMFKKCTSPGPDSIRSQLNGLKLLKDDDGDDLEIIHAAPIINALISTFDLKAQGETIIDYIQNVHNKGDGRSKEAIKARKAEADRVIAEAEAIKEQQAADRKSPKKKAPAKKPTKAAKAKAAAAKKSVVSKASKTTKWAKE